MSLLRPEQSNAGPAIVGFGRTGYCWRLPGNPTDTEGDRDLLAAAISALPAGYLVQVVAGLDLAVHWLQVPPASLRSLLELRLVAAARCIHLYGGAAEDWWIAADWDARTPFTCAALPASEARSLANLFEAGRLKVQWHTSWTAVCKGSASAFPSDGWSGLRTASRAFIWCCSQGRIANLTSLPADNLLAAPRFDEQVGQLIELESLRNPALTRGVVHWQRLSGEHEAHSALAAGVLAFRAGA
ncbi:MAG: hypothetical protein HY854_25610 [Burkholderiales bacterium]|nr:hypothetical protein [Burkholderiales bacterium]